jgi:hypothetical protein
MATRIQLNNVPGVVRVSVFAYEESGVRENRGVEPDFVPVVTVPETWQQNA